MYDILNEPLVCQNGFGIVRKMTKVWVKQTLWSDEKTDKTEGYLVLALQTLAPSHLMAQLFREKVPDLIDC